MGKGDKKTKRGKIFTGSYGNVRPKPKKIGKFVKPEAPKAAEKKKSTKKTKKKDS